ncbi:MAG: Eco57I restriction-modification methylase domain-containing protein [Rhizobiaceae bacterium]
MGERVDNHVEAGRPWQADLCQFFTRDHVARLCLRHVGFPENPLAVRLLEPAAGQGAFLLPLLSPLVKACQVQKKSYDQLCHVIHAYEIDGDVAEALHERCVRELKELGVAESMARHIAGVWIRNKDFLEARPLTQFTHIVGNPPYIRWDAIPTHLRSSYRERFSSFKQRADLYIAFIERSLQLLEPGGRLAFLCPGTWTRNVYGSSVREAFTSQGHLRAIIDFSDVDSFETSADAYPHFFVFEKGTSGPTSIVSMAGSDAIVQSGGSAVRTFLPSSSPLLLSRNVAAERTLEFARRTFPKIEDAGCVIRVGSATGCNDVFLGLASDLPVERSRTLPFVNARSIRNGKVHWTGTHIVNVFDANGKVVDLAHYPRMAAYLQKHKKQLQSRAKASKSKTWWRSIDSLHPDWYASRKLLVVDVSATPVIGIDTAGCCAGSGVYQIKSTGWPLKDLLVLLSAGVLGLFVTALSAGAATGFHRFQKSQLSAIHIPRWDEIEPDWKKKFRLSHRAKNGARTLELVAELYQCEADLLASYVARDWADISSRQTAR